ncbi:Hypothetical predicted protein [Octopus vulgaris]|uniref:Uncharacterized protein n=1 Tax=Octopus vulgaris TaxID=6645 RepID=A0AA36FHR4_OCTVU|nr:Hypothetical predicted protein [Octopus vulgaris]
MSADDGKGQSAPQQQVICPSVSSPHCPSDGNILDVTVPGDHIVNQAPIFGPWVHPGSLVDVRQLVQGIGDGESLFSAEDDPDFTITKEDAVIQAAKDS